MISEKQETRNPPEQRFSQVGIDHIYDALALAQVLKLASREQFHRAVPAEYGSVPRQRNARTQQFRAIVKGAERVRRGQEVSLRGGDEERDRSRRQLQTCTGDLIRPKRQGCGQRQFR